MKPNECWYKDSCKKFPDGCDQTCLRFSEMLFLVESSGLPKAMWNPKSLYAGKDKNSYMALAAVKGDIKKWVEDGNNLYIYSGNTGNGKTSWAVKLMLSYFNKVWAGNGFRPRGVFISVPAFIERIKSSFSNDDPELEELKQLIMTCDLVVWDDIGAVKLKDFSHSILFTLIDTRINSNLSNIYTSNIVSEKVSDEMGARLASRIVNTANPIGFADKDKRGS